MTVARFLPLLALIAPMVVRAQPTPTYYWKLDGTSGATAIASAGGTDGTLVGGTLWDASGGHHQGAARFDGVNDRIVLGPCDLTNGGDAISLSLWFKPDFVTGMERTLIAKTVGPQLVDHVWSVTLINATALRFRLKTGGNTTELSTPPSSLFGGAWYHLVAVYDGSEMRLYVNGGLMGGTAKSGSIGYHPQSPAALGATSSGTQPFSGWLDDVRIYDTALTDAEIIDILFEDLSTSIMDRTAVTAPLTLQHMMGAFDQLSITDHLGRMVVNSTSAVDLPPLSAGLYLVCLQGHGKHTTLRLVVP